MNRLALAVRKRSSATLREECDRGVEMCRTFVVSRRQVSAPWSGGT